MPAFSVLLGRVMDTIGDPAAGGLAALDRAALWFLHLGAAAGAAALAEAAAWGCAGVRAGRAARVAFLAAALAKPMAFHEGAPCVAASPAVAEAPDAKGQRKSAVEVAAHESSTGA